MEMTCVSGGTIMSTADEILAAALALPPDDRAQLANRLFESMDESDELEVDEQLETTIVDRLEAYDRGEVEASDWADVKARIEASLNQKRPA
jgi:putative addiction module component (TIGR02574 family)